MSGRTKIILAVVAALVVLWLGLRTASSMYFTPRADVIRSIGEYTSKVNMYADAKNDRPRLERDLQRFIDQTLGGDVETVDHKLRTRLNRLGEHCGVQNLTVGTGTSIRRESPAKTQFNRGPLRIEPDFVELPGWISGQGNYEQTLRLIGSIENEPWIKRIDQVKIDPRDNGGKFDVTVRLTTLFLPGKSPRAELPATISPPDLNKYALFAQSNPFRLPPAPSPDAVAVKPPPATPQGFPYEQWALTGVAESPAGPEAWLLNNQTRESRRLIPGESLQEAVFLAASGDSAEFKLGDQRFLVSVGQNLNDRTPVSH